MIASMGSMVQWWAVGQAHACFLRLAIVQHPLQPVVTTGYACHSPLVEQHQLSACPQSSRARTMRTTYKCHMQCVQVQLKYTVLRIVPLCNMHLRPLLLSAFLRSACARLLGVQLPKTASHKRSNIVRLSVNNYRMQNAGPQRHPGESEVPAPCMQDTASWNATRYTRGHVTRTCGIQTAFIGATDSHGLQAGESNAERSLSIWAIGWYDARHTGTWRSYRYKQRSEHSSIRYTLSNSLFVRREICRRGFVQPPANHLSWSGAARSTLTMVVTKHRSAASRRTRAWNDAEECIGREEWLTIPLAQPVCRSPNMLAPVTETLNLCFRINSVYTWPSASCFAAGGAQY